MKILNDIIIFLAAFLGTGLVIRLVKEYIAIGKREEDQEEDHK